MIITILIIMVLVLAWAAISLTVMNYIYRVWLRKARAECERLRKENVRLAWIFGGKNEHKHSH